MYSIGYLRSMDEEEVGAGCPGRSRGLDTAIEGGSGIKATGLAHTVSHGLSLNTIQGCDPSSWFGSEVLLVICSNGVLGQVKSQSRALRGKSILSLQQVVVVAYFNEALL